MYIYTSIYFRVIFMSIILNVHNDPCFEVVVSYSENIVRYTFPIEAVSVFHF